jgi:hypothetical protein
MKRRHFLKSSLVAAGAAAVSSTSLVNAAESRANAAREFYELRLYQLRRGPMQKRFDDYYRDAAIPALNRAGIARVGVFGVVVGPDNPTMYVLIPHQSMEAYATALQRVQADAGYQKAGGEFLNARPTDPSYIRVESSLLVAFGSMPKLELPAATAAQKPRIFELRTYESHSQDASRRKVEMFNQGEIAIFRRTGLTPVFFGETLIGGKMPNLAYMLVFDDMVAREKSWDTFRNDPEWKKLSTTPGLTDPELVTDISNVILRPTPYSQI